MSELSDRLYAPGCWTIYGIFFCISLAFDWGTFISSCGFLWQVDKSFNTSRATFIQSIL